MNELMTTFSIIIILIIIIIVHELQKKILILTFLISSPSLKENPSKYLVDQVFKFYWIQNPLQKPFLKKKIKGLIT